MRLNSQIVVGISILVGVSTGFAGSIELQKPAVSMIKHSSTQPRFARIVAEGYFNLRLLPTHGKQAKVNTLSYGSKPISVMVHDNTLFLSSSAAYIPGQAHPTVSVALPYKIKSLVVHSAVNVTAKTIASKGLKLRADGYGHIRLQRVVNLDEIDQQGNNIISVAGINSHTLMTSISGYGHTTLKGKVNRLYARLNNDAVLKARQLAAKHIYVQAKYHSFAYVSPVKTIRAFADQSGEVYYYKNLNDPTRYTVDSGNTLYL